MNLKCLFGHQWNDSCKCERCGVARDEGHKWENCKCKICGISFNNKFFVFIAEAGSGQRSNLGSSISSLYGDLYGSGDVNIEANKLKKQFSTDEDLKLILVAKSEWSPVMSAESIGGGMSSVNFNLEASMHSIEKYLKQKGFSNKQVSTAIKISTKQRLQSTDSTVGRFFIGIPI